MQIDKLSTPQLLNQMSIDTPEVGILSGMFRSVVRVWGVESIITNISKFGERY